MFLVNFCSVESKSTMPLEEGDAQLLRTTALIAGANMQESGMFLRDEALVPWTRWRQGRRSCDRTTTAERQLMRYEKTLLGLATGQ